MKTEPVEHGVQWAFYSNGPDGFRPSMECLCGWFVREYNWEEAGAAFDQHLMEGETNETD